MLHGQGRVRKWLPAVCGMCLLGLAPNLPALNTNQVAEVAVGQPDFASGSVNQGGSPAANTLDRAWAAIRIGDRLIVSGREKNRVLKPGSASVKRSSSSADRKGRRKREA